MMNRVPSLSMKYVGALTLGGLMLLGCDSEGTGQAELAQSPDPNEIQCDAPLPDTDYERVPFITGLELPLSVEEAPDGRFYVIERPGRLKVFDPLTLELHLAGTLDVAIDAEFGLLGMALDPNFATTGWLYLFYTLPEQPGPEPFVGRLSRFTMDGDHLDLASEVTLLEVPQIINFHVAGHLEFGPGRELFLSTGSDDFAFGPLHNGPSGAMPCNFGSDVSDCAVVSSSNSNDLRGKLIRVVPRDFPENLADPPYTIPPGNLFSASSTTRPEIYSMGHRNPFRFSVDGLTGVAFVAEVGSDFEELNRVDSAGYYGWPLFEGDGGSMANVMIPSVPAGFDGDTTLPPARPAWVFYKTRGVGPAPVETPLPGLEPNRSPGGALMAGPVYHYDAALTDITRLPVELDNTLFAWDFTRGLVWGFDLDTVPTTEPNLSLPAGAAFPFLEGLGFGGAANSSGDNGTIDMMIASDDHLYVLEMWTGTLYRINYLAPGVNRSPVVVADVSPTAGAVPLSVSFDASDTTDPEGDALTFEWDFDGDALIDVMGENPPDHLYTTPGVVLARLVVSDSAGNVVTRTFEINAGNDPAEVTILAPAEGGFFQFGDEVEFEVSVTDSEDGSTGGGTIACSDVQLIPSLGHAQHQHGSNVQNACSGSFATLVDQSHTDDSLLFYSVEASYTDMGAPGTDPVTAENSILIHPKRREAEFAEREVGTRNIENSDAWTGGELAVSDIDTKNRVVLEGRNLENMKRVKYRVASGAGGGHIELRLGGTHGQLLSRVEVPNTGGFGEWLTLDDKLPKVGGHGHDKRGKHDHGCRCDKCRKGRSKRHGPHDLYFLFKGTDCEQRDLFDLNWIEFTGDGIGTDVTAPSLSSVSALSDQRVSVVFSELVTRDSAEQTGHYTISGGINVLGAVLRPDEKTVLLETDSLPVGQPLTLEVSDVVDTRGLEIAAGSTAPFVWIPGGVNEGLVAYFAFSEGTGTNTADLSGNGHVGSLEGGAAWTVAGAAGNAVELDGVDDAVDIDDLVFSGDFSVAAWVKLAPGISGQDGLLGQNGGGQDLNFHDGRLRLFAPGDVITANTVASAERWTHYVVSRQGTLMKIYVDGELDATNVWPSAAPFTPKVLGRGNGGFLEGTLDEVRFYDREISADEVGLLFLNEPEPPTIHFKLDGGAGDTAFDSTAMDFTAPLVEEPPWINALDRFGLSLNGVDQAVDIPDASFPGDFTLAAWVLLSGNVDNHDAIVGSDGAGPDVNFAAGRLRVFDGTSDVVVANSTTPPNHWVHAAVTRSGTTTRIFLDGVEDAAGSYSDVFEPRVLGAGNAGFLRGALDDVRLYDRALSDQQLLALSAIPAGAPLAHWLFDDGVGLFAGDAVRDHTGELVGGASFGAGKLGGAVEFDGVDDWINLPPLQADDDFTLAAWVYLDGPGSEADVIAGQAGSGPDIHFEDGHLNVRGEMGNVITSEGEMPFDRWVHVTVLRLNGAYTLYFDAEPDPATGCSFESFGFQALGAGTGGFFSGSLDDVRFYRRALRYAEVRLLVRQVDDGHGKKKGHGKKRGKGHDKGKGKGHGKGKGKGHNSGEPNQCADPAHH